MLDRGTKIGDLVRRVIGASDSLAMILTCPSCASSYFVEDDKIGPLGRIVRCTSCGERWTARLDVRPDLGPDAQEWSAESIGGIEPGSANPAINRVGGDGLVGTDLLDQMSPDGEQTTPEATEVGPSERPTATNKPSNRGKASNQGLIWALAGLVLASLVVLAAMFRSSIVVVWPKAASAYAVVGLAINPTGLVFEKVKAVRVLQDGRAALRVSGAVRNIEDEPRDLPPIRIALLDPQGKEVMVQIGRIDGVTIPPRQDRFFATVLIDPPTQSRDLSLTFELDKPSRAHKSEPAHP